MDDAELDIVTKVVGLDYYPFSDGQVRRDGIENHGQKYSAYRIDKGRFQCSSCGKIFEKDNDVLPVWWENKTPTNFVCIYDRGLLKSV